MSCDDKIKPGLFSKPVLQPVKQANTSVGLPVKSKHQAYDDSIDIIKSSGLTKQAWQEELDHAKHRPWNASLQGRTAIRLFARGLIGASFFAVATRHATTAMETYHPEGKLTQPLHYIARGIDRLVGRPLEGIVNAMGHDGKAFVTFRPTQYFYGSKNGATLGHEAVAVTFDFASMSMGDAMGRDIAGALDPNVHHNWMDEGGHINYKQVAKNVAKSAYRYVTYNSGEDWAVAIPYTFFVRAQRNLINKVSPGFGYDSDKRLNGGSFKVNEKGDVVGTYGLEGALDLQGRFTAYNVGTLMYREAYTYLGNELKNWYNSGMKLPSGPKSINSMAHTGVDSVGKLTRWMLRDVVKANMYMAPAMPAFWMFRTPQTKYRGTFIHPEKGVITFGHDMKVLQANEINRAMNLHRSEAEKFSLSTETQFAIPGEQGLVGNGSVTNPFAKYAKPTGKNGSMRFDAYEQHYGTFDAIFSPIGEMNNKVRRAFHKPTNMLKEHLGVDLNTKQLRFKNMTDSYVNAAFAYTPYFFMKNDVMAYNWDTAKMDLAIERAIDGVTHFKPGEFKEGLGEIWSAMRHKPFKDPAREVEARKAICDDESPADGQNFYANARCFDSALQSIALHKEYHDGKEAQKFVERLQDSKKRSRNMLDEFRQEAVDRFTDIVKPADALSTSTDASFADREKNRKIQSLSDFPDINTTLH